MTQGKLATLPLEHGHPHGHPHGHETREAPVEALSRRLRIAGRSLARHGMVRADGEASVRLDEARFLMAPDMPLGLLTPQTPLLVLPLDGELPEEAPADAGAHRAIYRARGDVGAILRALPPHLTASLAQRQVPGDPHEALSRPGSGALASLGRRGALAAGHSIDAALAWLWQWEEAARLANATAAIAPADIDAPDARAIDRIWQFCTDGDEEAVKLAGGGTAALQPEPQDFDYWQSPGHLLRRCTQRAHDIFHEVLAEKITVTRQQFVVLWAIRDNPEASQQRLSEVTGWDRNTMAGMLARLQEQALIERRRDARDARLYRIHLTAEGLAMLRDMVPDLLEVRRRVLEPLPPELRGTFVECARKMLGLP